MPPLELATGFTPETRNMWFILESLPAMPQESLLEAGQMMCDALQQIMPGAVINKTLITSEGEQAVDEQAAPENYRLH